MTRHQGSSTGLLIVLLVFAGCGMQTPSPSAYQDQTESTISTALTSVATTRVTLSQLVKSGIQHSYAVVLIEDSGDALDAATTSYSTFDPPPSRDDLFREASTLLEESQDLVLRSRVAVNRDRASAYAGLVRELASLDKQLARLDKRLR